MVDIRDKNNPFLASSLDTPGNADGIFLSGSSVFVADHYEGLRIIDVTDPFDPLETGAFNTPGTAQNVFVYGDHAYVGDDSGGLQIIDVSDLSAPFRASSFSTAGAADSVFVSADVAFVTLLHSGIEAVDVSVPDHPVSIGEYDTPGVAMDVFKYGGNIFVADGDGGVIVLRMGEESPSPAVSIDMDIETADYEQGISRFHIESTANHRVGSEILVGIVAQGVTNLDTYQVEVLFDPQSLEFVNGFEGNPMGGVVNLLKKNGGETLGFQAVETAPGAINITSALAGDDPQEAPEGTGIVALLQFRVLNSARLELGNVVFIDTNGSIESIGDLRGGSITTSCPWDFSGDGIENFIDLGLLADHWLVVDSDEDWNPLYNLYFEDGADFQIVNYLDLNIFADHWLEECD